MKGQSCKLTAAKAAEFVEKASPHGGPLELDHITELDGGAAESLVKSYIKNKGYLGVMLNGLTALTDEAVEALAKSKVSCLYLSCLTTLTDKGAEYLAKFKGHAFVPRLGVRR